MRERAARDEYPKALDVFRYKFHSLFHVAPAQDRFMCRLRIPNGIVDAHKLEAIADLAERYAAGYAHLTTRANLQMREIAARDAIDLLQGLALHHAILNHRELYDLPRKFNIAFDGGGRVSALEDTNDIGFAAMEVPPGNAVPAGIRFRVAVGGITGHGDFAADLGVAIEPDRCMAVAIAILRVFIDEGDRSGSIRLTVFQNLIVSDIAEADRATVEDALAVLGLRAHASPARAGIVACTGNVGCRFSASDTKRHALAIVEHLERTVALDMPLNIHVTGCPHSCAQHAIADIGLLGARVAQEDERDVEGYHVYAGGGFGAFRGLGREVMRDVRAQDVPPLLERLLGAYLERPSSAQEPFAAFARRHSVDELRALALVPASTGQRGD